jgi:hypothetical protein
MAAARSVEASLTAGKSPVVQDASTSTLVGHERAHCRTLFASVEVCEMGFIVACIACLEDFSDV